MDISIVTATLNSKRYLPALVESLQNQTDKDFEWVIADGLSNDGTVEFIQSIQNLKMTILVEKDCGIYDALNRAVREARGRYYLVLGSDDFLYPDAIKKFKEQIQNSSPAFIAAGLIVGQKRIMPKKNLGWLYGMAGVASSHSVGLLIRKDLHDTYGYYSSVLKITADQLFVKSVIKAKESIIRTRFISGRMAPDGFSSKNVLRFQMEFFLSQIQTERFKLLQILLFFLRLLKNYRSL
ncbi:glycosyltransferase [Leptospira jelokensis]|uniref:glycosyltransferase n=1 Tax=Leptospira jelokensis TaxID=2484931 RepID=UPI001090BE11|nr:glycosyltransferase [Leptospira jelokensis]TGL99226.1 glycosyltransferase [Leptospira jelokensis]